jgi:hypothetical protein
MGTSYNPKIVTDGLVLNLDPANVKSYPANQDPFVNNVSLMLDFNQDFTDKSINSSTVVSNGSAAISSIQSKFGNYSGSFTNSNSYLQIANSSLFNLTSSNFTIEAWVYPTTSSGDRVIVAKNQGSYLTGYEWWFGINNNNTVAFTFTDSNTTFYSAGTVTTVSANTWTHIAAVRSGNTVTVYINGVSSATVGAQTVKTTASDVSIARDLETAGGGRYYTGYIDDLRITKAARYTANFTPPAAPLSLPGRLTDLTQGKNNQTLNGSPVYSSSNGGIMTFNGTTAYTIGARPTSLVNGGQITIALWAKWTTVGTTIPAIQALVDNNHNSLPRGFIIQDRPDLGKVLTFSVIPNGNGVASTIIVGDGTWHHIVCTNNGTNSIMYIDGKYNNSGAEAGGISSVQPDITIGKWQGGTRYLNGSVANVLFYNRALTAAEVFQNYNATKGRFR